MGYNKVARVLSCVGKELAVRDASPIPTLDELLQDNREKWEDSFRSPWPAYLHQWNGAIKSLRAAKPKEAATIKTALDVTEQALRDRYGDPYLNQKDRKDRLRSMNSSKQTFI